MFTSTFIGKTGGFRSHSVRLLRGKEETKTLPIKVERNLRKQEEEGDNGKQNKATWTA